MRADLVDIGDLGLDGCIGIGGGGCEGGDERLIAVN